MPGINYENFYDPSRDQYNQKSGGRYKNVADAGMMAVNPLWGIGSKFASGLFNMLSGKSQKEKNSEWLFNKLRGEMNQPSYRPQDFDQLRFAMEKGNVDYLNKILGGASRKAPGGQGLGEALTQGQSMMWRNLFPEMAKGMHYNKAKSLRYGQVMSGLV